MYPIDERDKVVELTDLPKPCGGAPMPLVVADEDKLLLSYFVQNQQPEEAGQKANVATLSFDVAIMHSLGPPNDEAIRGHPLWRRGLESYNLYRVDDSSLIRRLATMNYVHPRNDPAFFDRFHHYVFTFHDSTFECVAQSYTFSIEQTPSADARYGRMVEIFRARDERLRSQIQLAIREKPSFATQFRWWMNALKPW